MSQQCRICGTITGQHGFSFGAQARVAQEQARKEAAGAAGVLQIPAELVPEDERDDFFAYFMNAVVKVGNNRAQPPEIRFTEE